MRDTVLTPAAQGKVPGVGGLTLAWTWYQCAAPKATLVVHPGFADHMGRYRFLVEAMGAADVDVFLFDPRGHGQSGGRRGHIERFEDYDDDLRAVLRYVTSVAKAPLVLFGHSQGGLVACHGALRGPWEVAGVVLSNPALRAAMAVPGWKIAMAQGLSRWLPTLPVPVGIPPTAISRDLDVVRAYQEDPLVFTAGTTRWGAEFLRAQADVLAARPCFGVPTLVLLGSGDQVIDAATTQAWARGADGVDVEEFAGAYHELANEPRDVRRAVLARLLGWVQATV